MVVTADHGNCETMIDPETGGPHTAHTLNPVPLNPRGRARGRRLAQGAPCRSRADAAGPLMRLEKPPEMTGGSLIE